MSKQCGCSWIAELLKAIAESDRILVETIGKTSLSPGPTGPIADPPQSKGE